MSAYPECYLDEIVETQGALFASIRDKEFCPDCDAEWFINTYMRSELVNKRVDEAHPIYANYFPIELWRAFVKEQGGVENIKRGKAWGGFLNQWTGEMYAYLHWYTNIPSRKLIELLPLSLMERVYPGMHDLDIDLGAKKLIPMMGKWES